MRSYEKDRSPARAGSLPEVFRRRALAHVRFESFVEERIADQSVAQVAQRPEQCVGRCLSDGEGLGADESCHGKAIR
jgi:hypothetical protein